MIVTGASPGSLGLATAQSLAHWGAKVVITSRNLATAQQAVEDTPILGNGQLIPAELDLCQTNSVANFSQHYREQHGERLDALINNAGIHLDLLSRWKSPTLSTDGYEIHWRTNYLGTFQLTQCLLPLLLNSAQETGNARLVNVVSQLHHKGRNEDMFRPAADYNSWVAYGTSKLALVHMTQTVHRLHSASGLSACSLHPGAVYSQIASKGLAEAPTLSRLRNALAPLERAFMFNTLEGAQTSLYCATDPAAKAGGYYRRCRQTTPSKSCTDNDVSQRIWDASLNT